MKPDRSTTSRGATWQGSKLRPVVVDDVAAAFELVSSGSDVVLLLPPGVVPGRFPEGPGRLAVMVGEPGDPDAVAAAEAMYAELFSQRGP